MANCPRLLLVPKQMKRTVSLMSHYTRWQQMTILGISNSSALGMPKLVWDLGRFHVSRFCSHKCIGETILKSVDENAGMLDWHMEVPRVWTKDPGLWYQVKTWKWINGFILKHIYLAVWRSSPGSSCKMAKPPNDARSEEFEGLIKPDQPLDCETWEKLWN